MNINKNSYFSKAFLPIALLCCFCTRAFALYNFSAENGDNVTIYYNYITNATTGKTEAEVETKEGFSVASYSGTVNIPATVTDDKGTTLDVTSIGRSAFQNCSGLTKVTIPNSVTNIGQDAFYNCSGLTSITIPNSVTSIGQGAFYKCPGLTSVIIPNSVTSIGEDAFSLCANLTSVTIPSSVTSIGDGAFSWCTSLTSITIPSSVTSIGEGTFSWCTNLTSITIPDSVTIIFNGAFQTCENLTSITIGKSVKEIVKDAFLFCKKLNKITLRGESLPKCYEEEFKYIPSDATLYCKTALLDECAKTAPWTYFKNRNGIPFSITVPEVGIAAGCFDDGLDFTDMTDVNAYIVSAFSPGESTVLLTRATEIPEGTGFIVTGTVGKTCDIPSYTTDYVYSNMLVGVLNDTEVSQMTTTTDGDYTNYVLGKDAEGNVAFVLVDKTATVSAYNAYLRIPTSAVTTSGTSNAKTSLSLSFDDDDNTTGISAIKEQSDSASSKTIIYNLNGQRKQNLTKGLNIVNGKKIFVK